MFKSYPLDASVIDSITSLIWFNPNSFAKSNAFINSAGMGLFAIQVANTKGNPVCSIQAAAKS